ncbi:MAG: hypothetical protein K5695_08280 [Oscillospiraceae bacterium]|nr:hypothetical protein [Oscillospiraceae bacterium]
MWLVSVFNNYDGTYTLYFRTPEADLAGLVLMPIVLIILGASLFFGLIDVSAYMALPFCLCVFEILLKTMYTTSELTSFLLTMAMLPVKLYAWTSVIWTHEKLSLATEHVIKDPFFAIVWCIVGFVYLAAPCFREIVEEPMESISLGSAIMVFCLMIALAAYPVFSGMSDYPLEGFSEEMFRFVRILYWVLYAVAAVALFAFFAMSFEELADTFLPDAILTGLGVIPLVVVSLLHSVPALMRGILFLALYGILAGVFHYFKGERYGRTGCMLFPFLFCVTCNLMHSEYDKLPLFPVSAATHLHTFLTTSSLSGFLSDRTVPVCEGLDAVFSGIGNGIVSVISSISGTGADAEVRSPLIVSVLCGMFVIVLVMGLASLITEKVVKKA